MPTLDATITCPECGHERRETMPTNACRFFYRCEGWRARGERCRVVTLFHYPRPLPHPRAPSGKLESGGTFPTRARPATPSTASPGRTRDAPTLGDGGIRAPWDTPNRLVLAAWLAPLRPLATPECPLGAGGSRVRISPSRLKSERQAGRGVDVAMLGHHSTPARRKDTRGAPPATLGWEAPVFLRSSRRPGPSSAERCRCRW
jgi:hypothetical protein